jgi:hypothetical protein
MTDSTEIKELAGKDAQQFNVAEMEHKRSQNFSFVYANNAAFSLNFYDLQITFGQIVATGPKAMHIEDLVSVSMSIEHAKALAKALNDVVGQYEKLHGSVRVAPTLEKV